MKEKIALGLLRISLGSVFLIFGIGKFANDYWARTMSAMPFIEGLPWPAQYSVWGVGVVEVLTAVCLISGFFVRIAGIVAAVQLTAILILVQFQETRDIALLGSAIYLAIHSKSGKV